MSTCLSIHERPPSPEPTHSTHSLMRKNVAYEQELAQQWWALQPECLLPTNDGNTYRLLFAGRPGGSAGPDVRDAVLQSLIMPSVRLVGDIEFHTYASDWGTHQHASDPRYNQVILHVVLYCDTTQPTRRQDGTIVPVCSLNDLPPAMPLPTDQQIRWPCQRIMPTLSAEQHSQRLQHAGILRFEQKTSAFIDHIRATSPAAFVETTLQHYNTCLLTALAEALGYGRDRAIFRALGLHLLGQATHLPEPLGRSPAPAPHDSKRLAFLSRLIQTWHHSSPNGWQQLQQYIQQRELTALRALFWHQGLSLARTDILICNVALPFAAAIARLEQDTHLLEGATTLYLAHPGLPSNVITRMMCQHIGLISEPHNACQQQGLHHIYQETCRQKYCSLCIAGREPL